MWRELGTISSLLGLFLVVCAVTLVTVTASFRHHRSLSGAHTPFVEPEAFHQALLLAGHDRVTVSC